MFFFCSTANSSAKKMDLRERPLLGRVVERLQQQKKAKAKKKTSSVMSGTVCGEKVA